VKRIVGCDSVHLERRKGNQKQAVAYCTKRESRKDGLEPFIWGELKEQGRRNDLEDIVKDLQNKVSIKDIIIDNPSTLPLINAMQKFEYMLNDTKRDWVPEVVVLVGDPGTGKTKQVHELESDLYTVPEPTSTVWFDGYKGQEAVLFDDFNGNIRYHLMLQLLDRYPMTVNVKGGFTNWCPKRIYITSNKEMYDWYPNMNIGALKRRISNVVYKCTEVPGNTMPEPIYDCIFDLC